MKSRLKLFDNGMQGVGVTLSECYWFICYMCVTVCSCSSERLSFESVSFWFSKCEFQLDTMNSEKK